MSERDNTKERIRRTFTEAGKEISEETLDKLVDASFEGLLATAERIEGKALKDVESTDCKAEEPKKAPVKASEEVVKEVSQKKNKNKPIPAPLKTQKTKGKNDWFAGTTWGE